jgi:hypothetical protein
MWYARLAQHWLNEETITCPRLTGDDFGGDINVECPVCLLAEHLNHDRDKDTIAFGFKVMANPHFLTYCLLWERDGVRFPMDMVINPCELLLEEGAWEQLARFYMAGIHVSPDSILNYKKGNDFGLYQSHNGTRLDRLDQLPIFGVDDDIEKHIKKIEATLKNPKVQMPTLAQLQAFADRLQEGAINLHRYRDDEDGPPRRSVE